MADFVVWYKDESSYLKFKEICVDKNYFNSTYQSWVIGTQKKIDEIEKQSPIRFIKVHIEPDAFLAWCKANSEIPNQSSRAKFAGVIYGDSSSSGGKSTH